MSKWCQTQENCYFELGDDNVKINSSTMTVKDCTFNMVDNAAPFQLGYGAYTNGNTISATNIRVIGNSGQFCRGNPVISGGEWTLGGNGNSGGNSSVTVNIDGISVENPVASLSTVADPRQTLQGNVINTNLVSSVIINGQYHPNANNPDCQISYGQNYLSSSPGAANQNGGSTVDSYTIPQFAFDYICLNEGNHAYAVQPGIVGSLAGNGILDQSCDCYYDQDCETSCDSCGYSDICSGNFGTDYVPNPNTSNNDCMSGLNLNATNNIVNGTTNYIDYNQITASNVIFAGANSTYNASNKIILKPGFKALFGSYFNAFIEACVSNKQANPSENEVVKNVTNVEIAVKGFNEELHIYPNPLNDEASIFYNLKEADNITLTLFNATGKHITTLAKNQSQATGQHQLELDARNLPAGLYYLQFTSANVNTTKKVMITK